MAPNDAAVPGWLARYPPDSDELVRVLSGRVTDRVLRAIADADYGHASEAHEAALRDVRKSAAMPDESASSSVPWEVLRLMQFSDPRVGQSALKSLSIEERAIAKAWACALLVRFSETERDGAAKRLMEVVSDVMPELAAPYASLIHWLLVHLPERENRRPLLSVAGVLQRRLGEFTPEA